MSIWKRLRVYSIGFGIGLLLVLYFFGDRGCGWLPSNRVKTSIAESLFESSDYIDCKLNCNGFTKTQIESLIVNGDVIFDKSKKDSNPREYYIEHDSAYLVFAIPTENQEPVYIVDDFEMECQECDSASKKYNKTIKLDFKKKK